MVKRVTVKWLEKMKACNQQVQLFEELFPKGAAFTRANLIKAAKGGLDIRWFACREEVTTDAQYNKYHELFSNQSSLSVTPLDRQLKAAKILWQLLAPKKKKKLVTKKASK